MKTIKKMQVICQALHLAMNKIKSYHFDFSDLSKQQYSTGVEEIFATLKSLLPPHSPDYIPLMQEIGALYPKYLERIRYMCYKIFWIMPLGTRADFRGVEYYVLDVHEIRNSIKIDIMTDSNIV
jgi:hypothetical protein